MEQSGRRSLQAEGKYSPSGEEMKCLRKSRWRFEGRREWIEERRGKDKTGREWKGRKNEKIKENEKGNYKKERSEEKEKEMNKEKIK